MDILLNPNIAYLFLLGGFLLGMLALATPGTGFFEISALFCLALAGYAVYNLSVNLWALILLVLSLVPFIYAIQKTKRELYLGISIFLLVIGSVFLFPRNDGFGVAVSPLVAVVASTLVAGFLWIAARKSIEVAFSRPIHDLDTYIGQIGEAKSEVHDEGSIQVGGELWSARSEHSIPEGSAIRVIRREGIVMVVDYVNPTDSIKGE